MITFQCEYCGYVQDAIARTPLAGILDDSVVEIPVRLTESGGGLKPVKTSVDWGKLDAALILQADLVCPHCMEQQVIEVSPETIIETEDENGDPITIVQEAVYATVNVNRWGRITAQETAKCPHETNPALFDIIDARIPRQRCRVCGLMRDGEIVNDFSKPVIVEVAK